MRVCRLVGLNRSSLNYRPKRPDDSGRRERLRELAAERRRFGYRPLGWLLAREGHVMNRKKLYRIYREEKLMVRRRGRRKRAIGTRAPLALPDALNRRWSLDFVSDALGDGRRFRILCVVDDFSRECLNEHVFLSLAETRATIAAWRDDYNYFRPHSSLGALTPIEFAQLKMEKPIPPPCGGKSTKTLLMN
jgi:putative transposase